MAFKLVKGMRSTREHQLSLRHMMYHDTYCSNEVERKEFGDVWRGRRTVRPRVIRRLMCTLK